MIARIISKFQSLRSSQEGSVAILVGISLFTIILGVGIAIDMGRIQMVRTKLQSAMDQAALSSSITTDATFGDVRDNLKNNALKSLAVNFPDGYYGTSPLDVTVVTGHGGARLIYYSFTATTVVPTVFMNIFGINSVDLEVKSVASDVSVFGGKVAIVIDNSKIADCDPASVLLPCAAGAGSRLEGMKLALKRFVDTLKLERRRAVAPYYVGVIPYAHAVNIGAARQSWTDIASVWGGVDPRDWGPGNVWGGCVMAPVGVNATNVTLGPPALTFNSYLYPPEPDSTQADADAEELLYGYYMNYNPEPPVGTPQTWRITGWRDDSVMPSTYLNPLNTTHQGPSLGCPREMLPFSKTTATIKNYIDTIYSINNSSATQGTVVIPEGLAWAGRMQVPDGTTFTAWETVSWSAEMDDMITNYTPSRKSVILISSTPNHLPPYYYSSYGFLKDMSASGIIPTPTEVDAVTLLDANTLSLCNTIKASSTEIYTIAYGPAGSTNEALLSACASDSSKFYIATTAAELDKILYKIGSGLVSFQLIK